MTIHITHFNSATGVKVVVEEIDADLAIAAAQKLGVPLSTQLETK